MNIVWLDSIDSTNSEALRRLPELPGGTVLAAREQTAGRGQRGNSWFAEPGKNLTFSIVLRFGQEGLPSLSAADSIWLNYLMSDVVALFLHGFSVESQIKWPNDIYVQRRKICGILIENTLDGDRLAASVIGVGLNINQQTFPQLSNATSLCQCKGEQQDVERCLETLCSLFEAELPMLFSPERRAQLFDSYSRRLFRKGVSARYHDLLTDREYTGEIQGVEPDGRLCIKDLDAQGVLRYYRFKEVSYIL